MEGVMVRGNDINDLLHDIAKFTQYKTDASYTNLCAI